MLLKGRELRKATLVGFLVAALAFIAAWNAAPAPATTPLCSTAVGNEQLITTRTYDDTVGITKSGSTYTYYGSPGTPDGYGKYGGIQVLSGTLENPEGSTTATHLHIGNAYSDANFSSYSYIGAGPVISDPNGSGTLLTVFHAEIWPGGVYTKYYSLLGLAKSTDGGATWNDIGEIIRPGHVYDGTWPDGNYASGWTNFDMGNEPLVEETVGGTPYYYIYFPDLESDNSHIALAVARATVSSVWSDAINSNTAAAFTKYDGGTFSTSGINGASTTLEANGDLAGGLNAGLTGGTTTPYVSWDSSISRYVLVAVDSNNPPPGFSGGQPYGEISMAESADGLTWTTRNILFSEDPSTRVLYPTLVGLGSDPNTLGNSFYLYYSHNGEYVRRLISCTGSLGGSLADSPSGAGLSSTTEAVWGLNDSNEDMQTTWSGSAWSGFSASASAGQMGVPSEDVSGGGTISQYTLGEDNTIYGRTLSGGIWGSFSQISTTKTPDSPTAVYELGSSKQDVFIRNYDGTLSEDSNSGSGWSGFSNLGGSIVNAPSAVSRDTGDVNVYAEGTDGSLKQDSYYSGSWHGWSNRGGSITSSPSAVAIPGDTTDEYVFARESDGTIEEWHWDGSAWSTSNIGGSSVGAPGAVSRTAGAINVYIRGTDNHLWVNSFYSGSWHGWFSIG